MAKNNKQTLSSNDLVWAPADALMVLFPQRDSSVPDGEGQPAGDNGKDTTGRLE